MLAAFCPFKIPFRTVAAWARKGHAPDARGCLSQGTTLTKAAIPDNGHPSVESRTGCFFTHTLKNDRAGNGGPNIFPVIRDFPPQSIVPGNCRPRWKLGKQRSAALPVSRWAVVIPGIKPGSTNHGMLAWTGTLHAAAVGWKLVLENLLARFGNRCATRSKLVPAHGKIEAGKGAKNLIAFQVAIRTNRPEKQPVGQLLTATKPRATSHG